MSVGRIGLDVTDQTIVGQTDDDVWKVIAKVKAINAHDGGSVESGLRELAEERHIYNATVAFMRIDNKFERSVLQHEYFYMLINENKIDDPSKLIRLVKTIDNEDSRSIMLKFITLKLLDVDIVKAEEAATAIPDGLSRKNSLTVISITKTVNRMLSQR